METNKDFNTLLCLSQMNIAILLTVYNRKEKTLRCLNSLVDSHAKAGSKIRYKVFLTDDGCTDGTREAIEKAGYGFAMCILQGDGNLYWNGGMIKSWKAAIADDEHYDGYLWLNDDAVVLPDFWKDLAVADDASMGKYGKKGIYVGSTYNTKGEFTYGGFDFVNPWTLKDRFVIPDSHTFQPCQCAHGNITYVSHQVVEEMGIFSDEYIHGASDHDYTYRAYKHKFPVLVMPHYAGICENDHAEDGYADFFDMPLRKRLAYLKSPFGFNLHNTLLFQKRCFPYRYPFVWLMGYAKAFCPRLYMRLYYLLRK